MEPFLDNQIYNKKFEASLASLLARDDLSLGQFILILANAAFLENNSLLEQIKALLPRFSDSSGEDHAMLSSILAEAPDLELQKLVCEKKIAGLWNAQSNLFRTFRPRRAAANPVICVYEKFDSSSFNFTKVPAETITRQPILGRDASFFFNKFPLTAGHATLVLDVDSKKPQHLEEQDHAFAWELMRTADDATLAFNSYGAYASVNHFHFQVIPNSNLPILHEHWAHNGGTQDYPASVRLYRSAEESWRAIDELIKANTAYNLIYQPGYILVIPRRFQGTYEEPAWTSGLAWYELGGNIPLTHTQYLNSLTDNEIRQALASTRLT